MKVCGYSFAPSKFYEMKKIVFCLSLPIGALILMSSSCNDKNTAGAKKLECTYTSDITLTNHNPDGVDYECDCEVDISAGTFKIDPGVEIVFKSGGALYVHDAATIKAVGTSSMPIYMSDIEGSWKGVAVYSDKDANELSYVEMTNAGNYNFATVIAGFTHDNKGSVVVNGKLKITNSTINGSKGYGVAYLANGVCTGFSGNQINMSMSHPLFIYAGELNNTSLGSCTFAANNKSTIAIYGKTSNADVTQTVDFIQAPLPYYGMTSLNFKNVTKMAAGTTIIMSNNTGIYVTGQQYLQINGTSSNPVTIKGETESAGFWIGLLVNTNNPNNVFNYLNIADGGSESLGFPAEETNLAMGAASQAQLTLNNCKSERNVGTCQVFVGDANGFVNNSPLITTVCTP